MHPLGTIPSKALRYAIYSYNEVLNNTIIRDMGVSVNPTIAQLRQSSRAFIAKQVQMRQTFYERNNVPVFSGHAAFIDPNTIEVSEDLRLKADKVVIATGSRPYHPPNVDFSHPRIFDSDTILDLSYKPQSITIYGAGVIGCEYASMFRNLGIKVNLVNTRDLSFLSFSTMRSSMP